ncbi:MAG: hypothetical protein NW215_05335 [Hyphomicrobiales bacterium]|nr:hypothetical protein [Hyphomicrobiales bacterium]
MRRLADYLPDVAAPLGETARPQTPSLRKRLADARAEGYAHGFADAAAVAAARRTEAEADAQKALAEARARWAADEGEALARRLEEAVARFHTEASAAIARALRPFLAHAVVARAAEEFAAALSALTRDGAGRIVIRAPADLISRLDVALSPELRALTHFEASDGCEAEAEANGALIETNIGAWLAALNAERPPAQPQEN